MDLCASRGRDGFSHRAIECEKAILSFISSLSRRMRKAKKDMVTLAARDSTFNRVVRSPTEERKWCPGCNRTLTIEHFTPLRRGLSSHHPYCMQCTPLASHRARRLYHHLVSNEEASSSNCERIGQSYSESETAPCGARSILLP